MATYTKGYKKQNPQITLLKTIIAVIALVIVLVLIAFIYDKATDWKDYKSYDHLTTFDQVLSQDKQDYVVYFYSTNTLSIEQKEDALRVLNDLRKDQMIYLVNTNAFTEKQVENQSDKYTRQNLLTDLGIESIISPMIVVVADGELEEVITGTININKFLESLDNDTYEPFN